MDSLAKDSVKILDDTSLSLVSADCDFSTELTLHELKSTENSAVTSVPYTDALKISKDCTSSNQVIYARVVNYQRLHVSRPHICVMCGRTQGPGVSECVIRNQNKDVCTVCDSKPWFCKDLNVIFKFCKGCKNFSSLSDFNDKPHAAKCTKCRFKSRFSYECNRNKVSRFAATDDANTSHFAPIPPAQVMIDEKNLCTPIIADFLKERIVPVATVKKIRSMVDARNLESPSIRASNSDFSVLQPDVPPQNVKISGVSNTVIGDTNYKNLLDFRNTKEIKRTFKYDHCKTISANLGNIDGALNSQLVFQGSSMLNNFSNTDNNKLPENILSVQSGVNSLPKIPTEWLTRPLSGCFDNSPFQKKSDYYKTPIRSLSVSPSSFKSDDAHNKILPEFDISFSSLSRSKSFSSLDLAQLQSNSLNNHDLGDSCPRSQIASSSTSNRKRHIEFFSREINLCKKSKPNELLPANHVDFEETYQSPQCESADKPHSSSSDWDPLSPLMHLVNAATSTSPIIEK